MNDYIFFGGDSFTWGEGLDLYIDSPYWIKERNLRNTWYELENKQTPDSITFRETNRFAGIVSNHFNTNQLVLDYNGGGFDASPTFFDSHSNIIPKAIIYQFTNFNRFNLHFNRFCQCEFCNTTEYGGCRPYDMYLEAIHKKIQNINLTKREIFYLEWLQEHKGIQIENVTIHNIIEQFTPLFLESMDIFVNDYLKKWNEITDVYFIDSWDELGSNLIQTIPEIKTKLIPLKGYDDNWYYDWTIWEQTFPYKRIESEFPKTENGHPTLIQHQYIADSIIHIMEK